MLFALSELDLAEESDLALESDVDGDGVPLADALLSEEVDAESVLLAGLRA